jgi:hypothetical protein
MNIKEAASRSVREKMAREIIFQGMRAVGYSASESFCQAKRMVSRNFGFSAQIDPANFAAGIIFERPKQ